MVYALEDKKGENIILMDIKDIASFTDYFVICTGTSDRMLDALANTAIDEIRKKHKKKTKKQGLSHDGWVVVDFGDVVLHLLSPDQREYYQLEELWEEGKVLLRLQ
ncbi:MAG: ribosome silencing factor [Anaerolineales bacterium]|nr:ribosome silencing factor [Anaerolineales bacterium]MCB9144172.1 ribosome silencing factor [Anaerolineales bacterium]